MQTAVAAREGGFLVPSERLGQLALEIHWHEEQAQAAAQDAIQHKAEIGKRLIEAKPLCGHGRFLSWAEAEFGWAHDHIENHMRLAANFEHVRSLPPGATWRAILGAIAEALEPTKAEKKARKRAAKQAVPADLPLASERYQLLWQDFQTADIAPESVDYIITDPPYPQEFLPLYGDLAQFANRVLKPGASALVMVGQSYLPEVMALMTPHIRYHWTLAYLTPGGQSVQLFQRNVNTFWKPVLWFVKGEYEGDWIGDVAKSAVNDNDKRFHDWGQSESGMADLIERFTYPGQTILDPFLGGGTTGVVAVQMNRRFIGIDIDEQAIATSAARLAAIQ